MQAYLQLCFHVSMRNMSRKSETKHNILHIGVQASLMKQAKKRLAEMREQNTAISESVIQDSPPEIHTILVSEDECASATNHLSVPKIQESPSLDSPYRRAMRHSREGSSCSIKSTELDNDTMVSSALVMTLWYRQIIWIIFCN